MLLDPTTLSGYNIACALRGPDFEDEPKAEVLKRITTGVVRWLTGMEVRLPPGEPYAYYRGSQVASPESAKEYWGSLLPETQSAVADLWKGKRHFRHHILDALRSLNTTSSLRHEEWLIAILGA